MPFQRTRRRLYRFTRLACFTALCIVPAGPARAGDCPQTVDQTYVDTLIQRAFYDLNTAEEMAATGMDRSQAVARAKRVVAQLKKCAETDPNRKYILWKAGELESQIYLEQEGLLLDRENSRQRSVDEHARAFNAETGRTRPDLGRLYSLCDAMAAADPARGEELDRLYAKRRAGLARDLVASVETAIAGGDFETARRELAYWKDNDRHLGLSLSQYTAFAGRVEARISLDDERRFLNQSFRRIGETLDSGDIGQARQLARLTRQRLDAVRSKMIAHEWTALSNEQGRRQRAVERKEDSLVNRNLDILKNEGVVVAKAFLDTVVRRSGVSDEKAGKADYAIMQTAIAKRRIEDSASVAAATMAAAEEPSGASVLDEMLLAAKTKAREDRENVKQDTKVKGRMTQVQEVRQARMQVAQEEAARREQQRKDEGMKRARQLMVDIYALLDKRKGREALTVFIDNGDILEKYVPAEDYAALKEKVEKAQGRR